MTTATVHHTGLSTMTARQRWLAALRMEAVDQLPFWPKIGGAYADAQDEPYRSMSIPELHRYVGSTWVQGVAAGFMVRGRTCSCRTEVHGDERQTVFETPVGRLREVARYDTGSKSWHPVAFAVGDVEQVKIMTAYYRDLEVSADPEAAATGLEVCGEGQQDAVTWGGMGTSPLMRWVEWIAGVENAHLLLMMHPAEVENLFDAMHTVMLARVRIAAELCPADVLDLTENTSTTLISPDQYRTYCFRHISEYARIVAGAGRHLNLHMCGHLKALLPMLAEVGAKSFEAFTSPPVGNTRLVDGRLACPDICLIGGTNATLWTQPLERILGELEQDLDALPHHRGLVVTSGGMQPPMASPDTLKAVCRFVADYPVRL